MVSVSVDNTVNVIKTQEGVNKPFDPRKYIYLAVYNLLATSIFGKRFIISYKKSTNHH
jgi:hypothetical protein